MNRNQPASDDICLWATGELQQPDSRYGKTPFRIYNSVANLTKAQREQAPYFVVWLHGMDGGWIEPSYLKTMQMRLHRRVVFMVPKNPESTPEGLNFNWGCCFYKKENKNNLGYVLGVLHKGFLTDLSEKISNLATLFEAERTMVMGYSMGGFGAFQLGGFAPDVFDVVVSAAGYGLGTLTPQGEMYDAPQPQATNNFEDFLGQVASNMVRVPIVLALHAEHDGMSSYRDVKAIIARLHEIMEAEGSNNTVALLQVPDDKANSDKSRKKASTRRHHHYFNYTLLDAHSEDFFWSKLRDLLKTAPYRLEIKCPQEVEKVGTLSAKLGGGMPPCPNCPKPAAEEGEEEQMTKYQEEFEEELEEEDEEVEPRDPAPRLHRAQEGAAPSQDPYGMAGTPDVLSEEEEEEEEDDEELQCAGGQPAPRSRTAPRNPRRGYQWRPHTQVAAEKSKSEPRLEEGEVGPKGTRLRPQAALPQLHTREAKRPRIEDLP
ncbi:rluC [Symbiodinium natans]|uniref:RluC protein n=1 Tax=Symbiodinium natans TaxID=878477 RepID=A0A812THN2_9DINO|nr:rluC [Symbiodinium natans]